MSKLSLVISKILLVFLVLFGLSIGAVLTSRSAYAIADEDVGTDSASSDVCNRGFLNLPSWYRGVAKQEDGKCVIFVPLDASDNQDIGKFIWTIAMNVIEIGSILAGFVAAGFILAGGFKYLTSAGSADSISKAKTTITNAIIGLVIAIVATAIIDFIFNRLNGV